MLACRPLSADVSRKTTGMRTADQGRKDEFYETHDRIDALRTDHLRELSGLAKVFVTISSAMLGLTLAPLAPDVFAKTGLRWLVATWISLATTATLGFVQLFLFSARFKARADYLWQCLLTDVVVQTGGSDEKLDEFSNQADKYKRRYDRQHRACTVLILAQGVALLLAFSFLAGFIWLNFKAQSAK